MKKYLLAAVLVATALQTHIARADNAVATPQDSESAVVAEIHKAGVLKVGVIVYPPFVVQDPATGEYNGPAVAAVNAVAAGLNTEITWVPVTWDTMIAGLQAHQYEILATAVYATEARKKVVDFVNFTTSGVCYVAAKSNSEVNELEDFRLKDLSIVIPSGASYETDLQKGYPKLRVTSKQQPAGGGAFYSDILTGRFDVTPVESILTPQIAAAQPDLKLIPSQEDCLAKPDFPVEVGFAINKGDAAFGAYLSGILAEKKPEVDAAIQQVTTQ